MKFRISMVLAIQIALILSESAAREWNGALEQFKSLRLSYEMYLSSRDLAVVTDDYEEITKHGVILNRSGLMERLNKTSDEELLRRNKKAKEDWKNLYSIPESYYDQFKCSWTGEEDRSDMLVKRYNGDKLDYIWLIHYFNGYPYNGWTLKLHRVYNF